MANTSTEIEATCIRGGVGTGKTQRLIERVNELLSSNVMPEDILVLCATPQAALAFTTRLTAHNQGRTTSINIITPRALALEVLADNDAIRWSGREPRLLAAFEEKFLMEDMKVSGIQTKRLREMLKFFYRSWTELADDEPTWLLPGEEAEVHALLKANLAFTRGIMEPEAANLAVNYLRTNENACSTHAYAHVLVDDYQLLSRASQHLAHLVATLSITVAGDATTSSMAYDSYPYIAGLHEFTEAHPNSYSEELTTYYRSHASTRAVRALLADSCKDKTAFKMAPQAEAGKAVILSNEEPTNEFEAIACTIDEAIAKGTPAARIVVATPNSTWAHNIASALHAHHVRAEVLPETQCIRGDIRDTTRCTNARIVTALDLITNQNNSLAWRCWCGYGDHLANSAAIANLRTFADDQGLDLIGTLRALDENAKVLNNNEQNSVVGMQRVSTAYHAGLTLVENLHDLKGRMLLDELTRSITGDSNASTPQTIIEMCLEDASAADDPSTMARRARKRLLAPHIQDLEAVAIVPYDLMTGISPDILVLSGFVNGFIPSRDFFDSSVTPPNKQKKIHDEDVRRVYSMVGKAERKLIVSYFTSVDLERASMLKLKIERIRLVNGVRMCTIAPSDFLEYLQLDAG